MASKEELDKWEIVAPSALAASCDDEEFEEQFSEFSKFIEDEDNRAQLLERLSERNAVGPTARSLGGSFKNWLGEGNIRVTEIIENASDLNDLKARLTSNDNPVRACGKRHSDNLVALPDPGSIVVDLSNWRVKRSAGAKKDSPCKPLKKSELVQAPYKAHEEHGKRFVLMFAWETLQDLADRGSKERGGDPASRFALINSGSFTHQTLAGPLSVGTHGSGGQLGAMCDPVVAVDILRLDGVVQRVLKPGAQIPLEKVVLPDGRGDYVPKPSSMDFNAAVVNLGTLGVVLAYWVEVRDHYWLTQSVETKTLDEALDWYEDECRKPVREWRHVEFLLMPEQVEGEFKCSLICRKESLENQGKQDGPKLPKIVRVMQCNPVATEDNARFLSRSPFGRKIMYKNALKFQKRGNGQTGAWSDVLIRNTMVPAHGFEVAVPLHQAKLALRCVLEGIKEAGKGFGKRRCKPTSPIGVRFVAGSDQYLAMSHRHYEFAGKAWGSDEWCFIEVPRLFGTIAHTRIPEEVLERFATRGVFYRLHWGQYAPPNSRDAAREYPSLRRWLGSRIVFGAGPRLLTHALASAFGLQLPARGGASTPRNLPSFAEEVYPTSSQALGQASAPGELDSASSPAPLVLYVQGSSQKDDGAWQEAWREALCTNLEREEVAEPRLLFVTLADLYRQEGHAAALTPAGLRMKGRGQGGSLDDGASVWVADDTFRQRARARIADAVRGYEPTIILAHGIGSLACYDALTHAETRECASYQSATSPLHFISFGSPIGNKKLRPALGGRISMPSISSWSHLCTDREKDSCPPIRMSADDNFSQWSVNQEEGGECASVSAVIAPLIRQVAGGGMPKEEDEAMKMPSKLGFPHLLSTSARAPQRALLVGVNRHADSSWDLEGCVNDVYKMSELLQSRFGYEAEHIRLLVDERATAENIRDRFDWLLEDARSDAQRLFYFSGHGTRLPGYNALEVVDQQDECLVTHDFSWHDLGTAVVDDEIVELYSQLPYDAKFTAIFDCCHAGGMSRSGASNVRGLSPPDDIRHRMMRFSGKEWGERLPLEKKVDAVRRPDCGSQMKRSFLGGARSLRPDDGQFKARRAERGHSGPYMPTLLYACDEDEFAFEHRVGTTAYGAFTYALTQYLSTEEVKGLSLHKVVEQLRERLGSLGYRQSPQCEGPKSRLEAGAFL